MPNRCPKIVDDIVASFNQLWECVDESAQGFELDVPYSATNGDFIRVSIQKGKQGWRVSDRGYLQEAVNENSASADKQVVEAIMAHYQERFEIGSEELIKGGLEYFRTADNEAALSGAVFDLAQFLAASRSSLEVEPISESRERNFSRLVSQAVRKQVPKEEFKKRVKIGPGASIEFSRKRLRFNAVALSREAKNQFNAVQFITGSAPQYYRRSITESSALFRRVHKWGNVNHRIAILDDGADGYRPKHELVAAFLEDLKESATSGDVLLWSEAGDRVGETILR